MGQWLGADMQDVRVTRCTGASFLVEHEQHALKVTLSPRTNNERAMCELVRGMFNTGALPGVVRVEAYHAARVARVSELFGGGGDGVVGLDELLRSMPALGKLSKDTTATGVLMERAVCDLEDFLTAAEGQHCSDDDARDMVRDVAAMLCFTLATAYAHRQQCFMHNDVKPGNVLLVPATDSATAAVAISRCYRGAVWVVTAPRDVCTDGKRVLLPGLPVLCDFEFATRAPAVADGQRRQQQALRGTPHYVDAERIVMRHEHVPPTACDMYGVGLCMLHTAAVGLLPARPIDELLLDSEATDALQRLCPQTWVHIQRSTQHSPCAQVVVCAALKHAFGATPFPPPEEWTRDCAVAGLYKQHRAEWDRAVGIVAATSTFRALHNAVHARVGDSGRALLGALLARKCGPASTDCSLRAGWPAPAQLRKRFAAFFAAPQARVRLAGVSTGAAAPVLIDYGSARAAALGLARRCSGEAYACVRCFAQAADTQCGVCRGMLCGACPVLHECPDAPPS